MKFEILPEIQNLKILTISKFRRKGLKDVKYWLGLREIITAMV